MDRDKPPIIDRSGNGYAGIPPPPPGVRFPSNPKSDPWTAFLVAVDEAKRGEFKYVAPVVGLYNPQGDYIFNFQCMILAGDAGPDDAFDLIFRELRDPSDPDDWDLATNLCYALAIRGRLADVPLLLDTYQRHKTVNDAYIISFYISILLETDLTELPDPAESPFDDYAQAVLRRYRELREKLGENALVLKGDLFGVRRLAELILLALQRPYFPSDLTRKFEASTGTDCSGFYKDSELQPLTVAAKMEEFLDDSNSKSYEDNVRYFFGHKVP